MKFIISFIENILRIKKIGQINLDFLTLDYACFHYDLSNLDKDEYNESEFLTATLFTYLAKQIHNLGRGKIRNFLTQQLVDWVEVYTLIDLVPEAFSYEEYKKKIQNYEYYGWLKGLANASGVGEPFLKSKETLLKRGEWLRRGEIWGQLFFLMQSSSFLWGRA